MLSTVGPLNCMLPMLLAGLGALIFTAAELSSVYSLIW